MNNAEPTFSSVKRKFGEAFRAKSDTPLPNSVPA